MGEPVAKHPKAVYLEGKGVLPVGTTPVWRRWQRAVEELASEAKAPSVWLLVSDRERGAGIVCTLSLLPNSLMGGGCGQ